MALVELQELNDGTRVSKDTSPNTRLVRRWRAVMESGDSKVTALSAAGVPGLGDAHPENSLARCQTVDSEPFQSGEDFNWVFLITAEYVTLTTGGPPSDSGEENPLLQPISVEWGEEIIALPMHEAYTFGTPEDRNQLEPVLNSAYQRFDPPPQRDKSILTLKIDIAQATYDATGLAANYKNRVNSALWYGFAEETVLLASSTARTEYFGETQFWRVTYVFKIDPDGWVTSVFDEGTYGFDDGGTYGKLQVNGEDVTGPIPLDGQGHSLFDSIGTINIQPQQFRYRNWFTFPRADFNDLNLTN